MELLRDQDTMMATGVSVGDLLTPPIQREHLIIRQLPNDFIVGGEENEDKPGNPLHREPSTMAENY